MRLWCVLFGTWVSGLNREGGVLLQSDQNRQVSYMNNVSYLLQIFMDASVGL